MGVQELLVGWERVNVRGHQLLGLIKVRPKAFHLRFHCLAVVKSLLLGAVGGHLAHQLLQLLRLRRDALVDLGAIAGELWRVLIDRQVLRASRHDGGLHLG